ncbi:MAG: HesA/MoeB/ThiF family protein [Tepidisphaeraceae bacterium]|jgi:molybdopterin/thiamine biosynthesis adenylyltransferase
MNNPPSESLTPDEKAVYEWQMWVPDFGDAGQLALKNATVLISRCGGVGGTAALYLAAAGVGQLILAHAGNVKPSDLNRQLLMTADWLGKPRVESAARRLRELNPRVVVETIPENITPANVEQLVSRADVIVDAAPLFEERLLLNEQAVRQNKPMVDCAMYELQAQITTIIPGKSPCLACLYPDKPQGWKRQFPVFGAVSGLIGSWGAMEAIKVIAALGQPLAGRLLLLDLRSGMARQVNLERRPDCGVCGTTADGL